MTWTKFWDMHSGGGLKENFSICFIEAPIEEAKLVFYNRFGHNPERVSCTCCGSDYSIDEVASLEEATAYHRNCASGYVYADTGEEPGGDRQTKWNPELRAHTLDGRVVEHRYFERPQGKGYGAYQTLEEYLASDDVLVIRADEIEPHERQGRLPEQGYVWRD